MPPSCPPPGPTADGPGPTAAARWLKAVRAPRPRAHLTKALQQIAGPSGARPGGQASCAPQISLSLFTYTIYMYITLYICICMHVYIYVLNMNMRIHMVTLLLMLHVHGPNYHASSDHIQYSCVVVTWCRPNTRRTRYAQGQQKVCHKSTYSPPDLARKLAWSDASLH